MKSKLFLYLFICSISVNLLITPTASGQQPDWNNWQYRLPVKIKGIDKVSAGVLPIDVNFTLKASQCKNPEREIRLIYKSSNGKQSEVPFQLSRIKIWDKPKGEEKAVPTVNARITFFDVSEGDEGGQYFILHGNPEVSAPKYTTDLKVSGKGQAWIIENSKIIVELRGRDEVKAEKLHDFFGDCGQIASVTIKSRASAPITNKFRNLHWNPGIYIPERGWLNAHSWDPPEVFEIEQGPIYVEVRRYSPLPLLPEVYVGITYRIFANRNYIWSGSTVTVKEDIGVVCLRTNELVFDLNTFTNIAWKNNGKIYDKQLEKYKSVTSHGDILRLPPDIPFLAAYNPSSRIGVASINLGSAVSNSFGGPPALFHSATYLIKGKDPVGCGGLFFWFKSYFNFSFDWDRKQRVIVPKGAVYSDRSLFYFYDIEELGNINGVLRLEEAVRNHRQLKIEIGPYPFAPSY